MMISMYQRSVHAGGWLVPAAREQKTKKKARITKEVFMMAVRVWLVGWFACLLGELAE
jgi:hypothetical protein